MAFSAGGRRLEFAGRLVSGVGPAVEAAVGVGSAVPLVEEQEGQRQLHTFWRQPVGLA